jgi:hypothetical protein
LWSSRASVGGGPPASLLRAGEPGQESCRRKNHRKTRRYRRKNVEEVAHTQRATSSVSLLHLHLHGGLRFTVIIIMASNDFDEDSEDLQLGKMLQAMKGKAANREKAQVEGTKQEFKRKIQAVHASSLQKLNSARALQLSHAKASHDKLRADLRAVRRMHACMCRRLAD